MNTKEIGERSEGQVLAALLKAGKTILMPFGDNQRYDLVVDEDGVFKRIQCKTGRLKNGVILFKVSSTVGRKGKNISYQGQVEVFGVYCPETDDVYLVPIEKVGVKEFSLRIATPKNGQKKDLHWAKDYCI